MTADDATTRPHPESLVLGRHGGKTTAMTLSAVMAGLATGTEWLIVGRVLFFPPAVALCPTEGPHR